MADSSVQFDAESDIPENGVVFSAGSGLGAGKYTPAADAPYVTSLCGVSPTNEGVYHISTDKCYMLHPAPGGQFVINFDCPQSGWCVEFEDLYRYLAEITVKKYLRPASTILQHVRDRVKALNKIIWDMKYSMSPGETGEYGTDSESPWPDPTSAPDGLLGAEDGEISGQVRVTPCSGTGFAGYGSGLTIAGMVFVASKLSQSDGRKLDLQIVVINKSNAKASVAAFSVAISASGSEKVVITSIDLLSSSGEFKSRRKTVADNASTFSLNFLRNLDVGEWAKITLSLSSVADGHQQPGTTVSANVVANGVYSSGDSNVANWACNSTITEKIEAKYVNGQ